MLFSALSSRLFSSSDLPRPPYLQALAVHYNSTQPQHHPASEMRRALTYCMKLKRYPAISNSSHGPSKSQDPSQNLYPFRIGEAFIQIMLSNLDSWPAPLLHRRIPPLLKGKTRAPAVGRWVPIIRMNVMIYIYIYMSRYLVPSTSEMLRNLNQKQKLVRY